MNKLAETSVPILPALAERWSLRAIDGVAFGARERRPLDELVFSARFGRPWKGRA